MTGQVWKARVRVIDTGPAVGHSSSHRLELSSTLGLGLDDSGPSSLDALLCALGSELLLSFRALLQQSALAFDSIELQLRARLDNPLIPLGVIGERGSPALSELECVCHLTSLFDDLDNTRAEAGWELARQRCVILASLDREITITQRLNII